MGPRIIFPTYACRVAQKEIAASSGAYSYGTSRIIQDLSGEVHWSFKMMTVFTNSVSVGDYTVILSAFEPQHFGKFSLKVESSHRFDLKALQQEGAGMYCKTVRGQWCVNHDP
jgi:calpain-7